MPENRTWNWLQKISLDFIAKEISPLHSPEINRLVTMSGKMKILFCRTL